TCPFTLSLYFKWRPPAGETQYRNPALPQEFPTGKPVQRAGFASWSSRRQAPSHSVVTPRECHAGALQPVEGRTLDTTALSVATGERVVTSPGHRWVGRRQGEPHPTRREGTPRRGSRAVALCRACGLVLQSDRAVATAHQPPVLGARGQLPHHRHPERSEDVDEPGEVPVQLQVRPRSQRGPVWP